jgi:hypothetical protein
LKEKTLLTTMDGQGLGTFIRTFILIEIGLTYLFLFTSPNNFDGVVVVCLEWAVFISPSLNKMHSQKVCGKIKVLLKTLLRKMLGT